MKNPNQRQRRFRLLSLSVFSVSCMVDLRPVRSCVICLLSQTRHKIKERGKSRSWRTEKNRKFRNNIFRDSSYYTIFRVRTKYFFSKFKIDKYEFITKIGKIEK